MTPIQSMPMEALKKYAAWSVLWASLCPMLLGIVAFVRGEYPACIIVFLAGFPAVWAWLWIRTHLLKKED